MNRYVTPRDNVDTTDGLNPSEGSDGPLQECVKFSQILNEKLMRYLNGLPALWTLVTIHKMCRATFRTETMGATFESNKVLRSKVLVTYRTRD